MIPPGPADRSDTAAVARLYSVLEGGVHGDQAERTAAAAIEEQFPGTSRLIRAARAFHSRAAGQAAEAGCRGSVFVAAGFPGPHEPPHARALERAPDTRYVYASRSEAVALVCQGELGGDRVSAVQARARRPRSLLALPEVKAIGKGEPLMIHLQLLLHFWPNWMARRVVASYARQLRRRRPGSMMALSLAVPGEGDSGKAFARALSPAGTRMRCHTEATVESWLEGAAMTVPKPGVADVRLAGRSWGEGEIPERLAGRIIGAVALVR